jgi:hypothetical protein
MFNTPILFILFNRLDTTKQVFAQIIKVQPTKLFIAADGPRNDIEGEKQKCEEVRQWVLAQVDWKCDVKTLFQEVNLGCGKGPATAIDWFFENVDKGIILEDDCLPNNSFFVFCETMLKRFENNACIMHISGNNFHLSQIGNESYYLSKLPHTWGWATWRRAWGKFDFELSDLIESSNQSYFNYPTIDNYWHNIFKTTKRELYHHVWDYQWVYALFKHNGLSIAPQHNLVSNIGFGRNSTHTIDAADFLSNLKKYEIEIEIEETVLNYDPIADINFHKLFKWEIIEAPVKNITAKEAISILFNKFNSKLKIGKH